MLYRLRAEQDTDVSIEPLSFSDFSELGRSEKDLESVLADHLLDVLFEDTPLMPIFRERQGQPEADLYALDIRGDLVIFELKRGVVGGKVVHQLLRYAQIAGQWTFNELERTFASYALTTGQEGISLASAHQEAFNLEHALQPSEFNRRQHLWLIGSAADEELINAVEYWRAQGLSMRFAPYRIYSIGEEYYFEFFAEPHDRHKNPAEGKGVLFDTNRAYSEDSIWDMLEKKRVAAYGDAKRFVDSLNRNDIVFYSHKGYGIIAAAKVTGPTKVDGPDEKYHDVEFLTPVPNKASGVQEAMSFAQVPAVTGKSFFWARTVKVPYLTEAESQVLLKELKDTLS